jgi:hypothetical protein
MSIDDDIRALVTSLNVHRVYEVVQGRAFDPEDSPPKDVISEGYRVLAHGTKRSIDNYNESFASLQKRFKLAPVSSMLPVSPPDTPKTPATSVIGGVDDLAFLTGVNRKPASSSSIVSNLESWYDDNEGWHALLEEDVSGIGFESEEEFVDDESDSDDER